MAAFTFNDLLQRASLRVQFRGSISFRGFDTISVAHSVRDKLNVINFDEVDASEMPAGFGFKLLKIRNLRS